jgi:hypothetical protein
MEDNMLSEKAKDCIRQTVQKAIPIWGIEKLMTLGPKYLLSHFGNDPDHPLDKEIAANRKEAEQYLGSMLGMM